MAFDENEPRDYHGRWTTGAGGDIPAAPDPRVATVAAGDIWNKDTAARLENEYAAARPALDKIATGAPGHETTANVAPHSWDDLSSSTHDDAESQYKENNSDSEYENEVTNWQKSGDALATAAQDLQHDEDWKTDTLADYLAEREKAGLPEIPYDAADLAKAIHLSAAGPDEYQNGTNVDPLVQFSASDLQKPTDLNPDAHHPDQLAMPGTTPHLVAPEDHLTQAVRADLAKYFIEEFNSTVEKKAQDVEPPDFLHENVQESLTNAWHSMSDEEKYDWTKQHTSLIDDEPDDNSPRALELPQKWDPLNETSGADYMRTQTMAKYLADTRAVQIMAERGIGAERRRSWGAYNTKDLDLHLDEMEAKAKDTPSVSGNSQFMADIQSVKDELAFRRENGNLTPTIDDIRTVDHDLWDGWKGSSSGYAGQLLQVAAADELGGRLREAPPPKLDVETAYKEFAASKAAQTGDLGEFATAVKAAFNSVSDVGAFATKLSVDPDMSEEQKKVAHDAVYERSQASGGPPELKTETITTNPGRPELPQNDYKLLPELTLQRNGAASFTTDRGVANGWGGTANKVAQGINRADVIKKANEDYSRIGGYDGVKAAMRAKWETTQYMLDKADIPVLSLYRGIALPHKREGDTLMGEFNPPSSGKVILAGGGEADLANALAGTSYKISSGKTITKTSNTDAGWAEHGYPKGIGTWKYEQPPQTVSRVVLRAEVPRTAVLSVPAYGINVHSEHEVVITGTAWHHWDAYSDRAPSHVEVPIGSRTVIVNEKLAAAQKESAASHAGEVTVKLTPDQEDFVAKYKAKIPKEQQL